MQHLRNEQKKLVGVLDGRQKQLEKKGELQTEQATVDVDGGME